MRIENGILYSVNKSDLEFDKSFVVPREVKKIARRAFYNVPAMKSLIFHSAIEEIDLNAFSEESELLFTNIIPNEMIDASIFTKCKNLKNIYIDGDIPFVPKYVNKLIRENKVNTLEFNWFDKTIIYQLNDDSDLIEITKVQDKRFIASFLDINNNYIIDYDFIKKYDFNDIKEYTIEDEKEFKKLYKHVLSERFDLLYDWIKLIQENKSGRKVELPDESILLSLPNTKEGITSYYIYDKKWRTFSNKYLTDVRSDLELGVTKLCYAIGYFYGKSDVHDHIEEFLKYNRQKIVDGNMGLLFNKIDFKQDKFDLYFGHFIRTDWANICNAYNWDVEKADQVETAMKKIYENFGNIKKYANQNEMEITFDMSKKFLALRSLETRQGNESLYMEVKPYCQDYGTIDYERMQDLYEKAQNPEIEKNKIIKKTKDKVNFITYEWLEAKDPVNFILGNKTGSCAKINDVGSGILTSSIIDNDVRNLVFRDEKARIIGKATAYFNDKNKYILFNTLYAAQNRTDFEKMEILRALKRAVSDQVKLLNTKEVKIEKVAIGMGRNAIAHEIQLSRIKIKHSGLLKNKTYDSAWAGIPYQGDANSNAGQAILYSMSNKKIKEKTIEKPL